MGVSPHRQQAHPYHPEIVSIGLWKVPVESHHIDIRHSL